MDESDFWNKMGFILSSEIRKSIMERLLKDSIIIQNTLAKSLKTDNSTISNNLKSMVNKNIIEIMNPEQRKGKIYKLNFEFEEYREKINKLINLTKKKNFEMN